MSLTSDAPPLPCITVQDVANESGVAPSAVRFYERYGVVTASRTSGNQRRFDDSAGCRIKVAKLAQRVGLTVREIADLFSSLPEDPGPEDWGRLAGQLITEAETRTADLKNQLVLLQSGAKLCEMADHLDSGTG